MKIHQMVDDFHGLSDLATGARPALLRHADPAHSAPPARHTHQPDPELGRRDEGEGGGRQPVDAHASTVVTGPEPIRGCGPGPARPSRGGVDEAPGLRRTGLPIVRRLTPDPSPVAHRLTPEPCLYRLIGYGGGGGTGMGFVLIRSCRCFTAASSWASCPPNAACGRLSTMTSGSTPWPSMSHSPSGP